MRYDLLMQESLSRVVKNAFRAVEKNVLPGAHHFFIAFDTTADGVRISEQLRQKYPREMTVVIQHRFWNLLVRENDFEVELSFNEVPERLVIPFSAIKGFLDPSVQFGLQFEAVNVGEGQIPVVDAPREAVGAKPIEKTGDEEKPEDGPKVVSLDAFRKK